MITIEPTKGSVLVSLPPSDYGDVVLTEKAYDSVTNGEILSVAKEDEEKIGHWVGRIGYWHKFRDDARITGTADTRKMALVEVKDILGTSYEKN
jgi:hypothetical protein